MAKEEGRFIKISFTEDIYNLNEAIDFEGFSIVFQEQLYIQSEIVETILEPIGVYYSDNIREIILEFTSISEVAFRNVIGNIELIYNMDFGHLKGYGGLVQSFNITFTPVGLVKNLPTNSIENINVNPIVSASFIRVDYKNSFDTSNLSVIPSVTVVLTSADIVNP